jgi:hypothetical protein
MSDEPEPIVAWPMPLSHARELYEYLHYTRPGGFQYDHDQLAEAIVQAEAGSSPKRSQDGYVEVRPAWRILMQLRNCIVEADAALDADENELYAMFLKHGLDSARDLDNLLSDDKSAQLPADWQRS